MVCSHFDNDMSSEVLGNKCDPLKAAHMDIWTGAQFVCKMFPLFSSLASDPCNRKMPEREDDHLTPATRLLEKRREMAEVEQALAAQKEVDSFLHGLVLNKIINVLSVC